MTDIRTYTDYGKFMKFGCSPSKGICCKALTLKFGVILTGVLDIALGLLCLLDLLLIIQDKFNFRPLVTTFIILKDIIGLVGLPFGVIGFLGITKYNLTRVHVYALYKQVEALILFVFIFVFYFFVICTNFDCDLVLFFTIWNVRSAYNFYLAYIVWSADVRLAGNEEILVMHGEQVVHIMNQQANSLMASQFVPVPGLSVPQIAVGMPVKLG